MGLFTLAAGSWWHEIWTGLWLSLCQGIYIFIGALYQVFEKVASVNLFSTEVFEEITGRLYVVMGIAMLFVLAYNLILMIINPDDKKGSSNQMGKVVKETITSLVLLVLLPTIFNYLYIFQSHVLESNIIGQVILGEVGSTQSGNNCDPSDYECQCDFSKFDELESYNNNIKILWGLFSWDYATPKVRQLTNACERYRNDLTPSQRGAYSISPTVLSAFYRPTNFTYNDCEEYLINNTSSIITSDEDKQLCVNYYYDVNFSKYTGTVMGFVGDSYLKSMASDPNKSSVEFHGMMAVVAGIFALYTFFCFAMEIGVRVAKLGFLQIISPIPVMMRIVPGQKEKVFDKWLKTLTSTYTDVFIRLVIIYFSLFGISLVPSVMNTLWKGMTGGEGNVFIKTLSSVFVILGLLKFAGDAPALFKEFFGSSGNFSIKSPRKQLQENKLAMGGIGAVGAGAVSAIRNYKHAMNNDESKGKGKGKAFMSALGGAVSGAYNGAQAGYNSNTLRNLKANISDVADKTSEARDERDLRQEQFGKGLSGYMGYRANRFKDSWDKWTSGDSYASLTNRKNMLQEMEDNYKKAIADVEDTLEKKATKFSVNGRSYYEYQMLLKRAEAASNDFREDAFVFNKVEEYKNKNPEASEAEIELIRTQAMDEAKKLGNELAKEAKLANQELWKVQRILADAILDEASSLSPGESLAEKSNFNFKKDGVEYTISRNDDMKGLTEAIEKANNSFKKYSETLSTELNETLKSSQSVRQKKDAVVAEKDKAAAKLAGLSELKKDDKK